jgi:transcriptional regulator with XRE-family HTH domain
MKRDNPKKQGSPLYRARRAKGLSMPELAKAAGTSAQQIDRLETGERPITKEWARRLAPHLDVDAVELVFPGAEPLSAAPTVPADLVQMALELVLRRLAGMSDSGAQELAALILEELLAPELLAAGLDAAALRGALDYIVRRSGRKSDA